MKTHRSPQFWIYFLILTFIFIFLNLWWFQNFKKDVLTKFENLRRNLHENTIFYDIEGKPFHVIQGAEDRSYVPISKINRNIQMSVVGIEDARFFNHYGFDIIRIGAAILNLFDSDIPLQGASTITQQLVKLTLLSPEITFSRKFKELFMAIALETRYSKKQILEFYLNKVYLGHRNYGIQNASLYYFDKSANQLSLAQASFLAGLIKKPEGYSPFGNLKKARRRQILVLHKLLKLSWINVSTYKAAANEKIRIHQKKSSDLRHAPYFTNHIINILRKRYGNRKIYGGGLRVYTTLDRRFQSKLEEVIRKRIKKPRTFQQIAGISLDPSSGFVKALVGGIDFQKSEFNRATQARRQPGSSFKPILYAAALEFGIKTNDVFLDELTQYTRKLINDEIEIYEPKNFNDKHYGEITVAHSLKKSNNVVSVKILDKMGTKRLARTAKKFGLAISTKIGLCLALGCSELSLLDLTSAYSVFANDGIKQDPIFILKVMDYRGNVLEEFIKLEGEIVLSKEINFQINHMLQGVVGNGTGRNAKIAIPSGGKTGTTNQFRDAWYIGYTKDLVTGFWVGNDDNTPMIREIGSKTPARLWKSYMQKIPSPAFQEEFATNKNFEDYHICNYSGQLAGPFCPSTSWYALKRGTEPEKFCEIHTGPPYRDQHLSSFRYDRK